jgi:hypothetical protein
MKKGLDPKIQALHSPSAFAPRGNHKTDASELRRTNFPQRNAEENLVELIGIEPTAS